MRVYISMGKKRKLPRTLPARPDGAYKGKAWG